MGFSWDNRSGRQSGGWSNKLIWGDNKLVLASLKNGPLRKQIEDAGGLKLVYIDPPFNVGADFSFDVEVGEDQALTKQPFLSVHDVRAALADEGAAERKGKHLRTLRLAHDEPSATGSR